MINIHTLSHALYLGKGCSLEHFIQLHLHLDLVAKLTCYIAMLCSKYMGGGSKFKMYILHSKVNECKSKYHLAKNFGYSGELEFVYKC